MRRAERELSNGHLVVPFDHSFSFLFDDTNIHFSSFQMGVESARLEGVFASRGYSLAELFAKIVSVAIHWRGSEGHGWSGWVQGDEAVGVGHLSSKSGRSEIRMSHTAKLTSPAKFCRPSLFGGLSMACIWLHMACSSSL